MIDHGFSLLWIVLRHGSAAAPWRAESFYFLVAGTDGCSDALKALERDGLLGVRLNTQFLRKDDCLVEHGGEIRLIGVQDRHVVGAHPAFIHAKGVAFAEAVPNDVALVAHPQLEGKLQDCHWVMPDEQIMGFIATRCKGRHE